MSHPFEIRNSAGEAIDHTFHPGIHSEVLVVIGHGVTGHKDRPHLVALAEGLAARGWPCLRISFSGNGASEGDFENSCITREIGDLQAVFDAVPDTANIIYVGHSMGGAVGVLTAARDLRIRILVSISGMTHTSDFVAREFGDLTPGEGFMWDKKDCLLSQRYVDDLYQIGDTLSAAAAVTQPWLLIHGEADDVVPIRDSEDAFEAADTEKEFVRIPGADHLFDEASYPQLVDAIDVWIKKAYS